MIELLSSRVCSIVMDSSQAGGEGGFESTGGGRRGTRGDPSQADSRDTPGTAPLFPSPLARRATHLSAPRPPLAKKTGGGRRNGNPANTSSSATTALAQSPAPRASGTRRACRHTNAASLERVPPNAKQQRGPAPAAVFSGGSQLSKSQQTGPWMERVATK